MENIEVESVGVMLKLVRVFDIKFLGFFFIFNKIYYLFINMYFIFEYFLIREIVDLNIN